MAKKKKAAARGKRPPVSQRLTKLEEAMALLIDRVAQMEGTRSAEPTEPASAEE